MKLRVLLVAAVALGAASCAGRAKHYGENPSAPNPMALDAARAVCESYYSPPFYHFCWVVKRRGCQRNERTIDQCMELRGWQRSG